MFDYLWFWLYELGLTPEAAKNIVAWLQDPGLSLLAIILIGLFGRHFGGAIIERIIRRIVRSSYFNDLSDDDIRKRQDTLISLFTAVWKTIVIVVVSLLIFRRLFPNIDLTPVFASAGIIGVALGFGAQSLIKDFLSGVFIILENQYRIGDVVDIEGAAGTVERIGLRSTVLRDVEGNVHYVPNGSIVHVINKTMDFSKVNFSLSVVPDTNLATLTELIDTIGIEMAKEDEWSEKILEAPHFLNVSTMTGNAIDVTIVGKTAPSAQWGVTSEMRRRLLDALHKHHIQLAKTPLPYQESKKK